jgi:inhibitor of KinA sporulation pathway (predicted exonuclease)
MWNVVDVRKLFKKVMNKSGSLSEMLKEIGMEFEGREHCGLDDAKNIARIILYLAKTKEARLEPNTNFKKNKPKKGAWCKMRK